MSITIELDDFEATDSNGNEYLKKKPSNRIVPTSMSGKKLKKKHKTLADDCKKQIADCEYKCSATVAERNKIIDNLKSTHSRTVDQLHRNHESILNGCKSDAAKNIESIEDKNEGSYFYRACSPSSLDPPMASRVLPPNSLVRTKGM